MKNVNVTKLTTAKFSDILDEFEMPGISEEAFDYSTSMVCERDGETLMIGGVIPLSPGVGEFWLAPNRKNPPSPSELYRVASTVVQSFASQGFVRLQMKTNVLDPWSESFPLHLGFHKECTMRKAGLDGADMHQFAYFPGEDE